MATNKAAVAEVAVALTNPECQALARVPHIVLDVTTASTDVTDPTFRVGINVSSHIDMGSLSGRHGAGKVAAAIEASSEASTVDTSELDDAVLFALDELHADLGQNPEMEETGMIGSAIPQRVGVKAMIEKLCDYQYLTTSDKVTKDAIQRLEEEKPKRLDAIDVIFQKVGNFVSLVLASYEGTAQLISNQKLSVQCLRQLKTEASKEVPNDAKIDKLSSQAVKMLAKSTLTNDLQEKLLEIKCAANQLVEDVRKEQTALKSLETLRTDVNTKAETAAKQAEINKISSVLAMVLAAVLAVIGFGAAHKNRKAKEQAEQEKRGEINAKGEAAAAAMTDTLNSDLENINRVCQKYAKHATDIGKACAASEIVKAHFDLLAFNGQEVSEQTAIVDMVKEIQIETLFKYEQKLLALKADSEHMVASAIQVKKHFRDEV